MAQNKTKEGVKTLPSGLQYKVVKAGTGKKPKATDTVVTHYKGTLLDGTEFDSSFKRNQPATFKVNGVIRGWTEALQLMEKGRSGFCMCRQPWPMETGEQDSRSDPMRP